MLSLPQAQVQKVHLEVLQEHSLSQFCVPHDQGLSSFIDPRLKLRGSDSGQMSGR